MKYFVRPIQLERQTFVLNIINKEVIDIQNVNNNNDNKIIKLCINHHRNKTIHRTRFELEIFNISPSAKVSICAYGTRSQMNIRAKRRAYK